MFEVKMDKALEDNSLIPRENLEYLSNVLSIKNISEFDVDYIMSRLHLNSSVIELLKSALEEYEKQENIKKTTSYSDYLFQVARYIELLEHSSKKLSKELNENKINLKKQRRILKLIIKKASKIFEPKIDAPSFEGFRFSKNFFD